MTMIIERKGVCGLAADSGSILRANNRLSLRSLWYPLLVQPDRQACSAVLTHALHKTYTRMDWVCWRRCHANT